MLWCGKQNCFKKPLLVTFLSIRPTLHGHNHYFLGFLARWKVVAKNFYAGFFSTVNIHPVSPPGHLLLLKCNSIGDQYYSVFQIILRTMRSTAKILLNVCTKKWDENAEESTTCFSAVWDIYPEVIPGFSSPKWYTYHTKKNFTSICFLLDCII